MTDETEGAPTVVPAEDRAFAELAAELLAASWVEDALPGMSVVPTPLGMEVYVVSASRGRLRIGTIPHITIAYRAQAIRARRN